MKQIRILSGYGGIGVIGVQLLVLASMLSAGAAELAGLKKVWDNAPHNAFTDLLFHSNSFYCVFREGKAHVSPDGAVRILKSADGEKWASAGLLTMTNADLRDPKITVAPNGRLMLIAAGALHQPNTARHKTFAWFSGDGLTWEEPNFIGETNFWLWRVTWHKGTAYSVGYQTSGEKSVRLYSSRDGTNFNVLVPKLFEEGYPNETSIVFESDRLICLLRRDGNPASGLIGLALPPYKNWDWKDTGIKIGGPQMIGLPDGRFVAGVRLYDGQVRTSLVEVNPASGKLTEVLKLPSSGDSSYAGLVWRNGILWMSYYSSHEGKSAIYLAQIKL